MDYRQAIDERVADGTITINKFIGEKPEDLISASGTRFFDMEGAIGNLK